MARRAPAGMTQDPCAICGHRGDEFVRESGQMAVRFNFREKDKPCEPCLKRMKDEAEELSIYRKRASERGSAPTDKLYTVSAHPYTPNRSFADPLAPALLRVAKLLGVRSDLGAYHGKSTLFDAPHATSRYAADFSWTYSDEEAEALENLFKQICAYGEHAYNQGKNRGGDLLLSLQAGDISQTEFESRRNGK